MISILYKLHLNQANHYHPHKHQKANQHLNASYTDKYKKYHNKTNR